MNFLNKCKSNLITRNLLIALSIYVFLISILSLHWHIEHDASILVYGAFLIDKFDFVLYRDIYELNLPGTYLIYVILGKIFGFTDFGFRLSDVCYLSTILVITWFIMRKFGKYVAWTSILIFSLIYFSGGTHFSLQRECILLLPISLAILIYLSKDRFSLLGKYFFVGLLFGIAGTIKPHAMGGLFIVWLHTFYVYHRGYISKCILPLILNIIGLVIPFFFMFFYLWGNDALMPFLDLAKNLWPLYRLNILNIQTFYGWEWWWVMITQGYPRLGGFQIWLVPAMFGIYLTLFRSSMSREYKEKILFLSGLAFYFTIYPIFPGKLYTYHWLPFIYFLSLLSALIFTNINGEKEKLTKFFILFVFVYTLIIDMNFFIRPLERAIYYRHHFKIETADKIAEFLKKNLKPGDTVQPLDWVEFAPRSLVMAKAKMATPYIYDAYFYFHVSHPYIQEIKKRFLEALKKENPRFIVQIIRGEFRRITGYDTTDKFPELESYIREKYKPVLSDQIFVVFEKKNHSR